MSNQELIPIFAGEIAGVPAQLVDARLLHAFLEVGKDFSTWIKDRIKQYSFQENQDYIIALTKTGELDTRGFQRPIDYHLALDMAKELSMVERNEKGRQARRYFIECEKHLLSGIPDFLNPITEPITLEDFNWRHQVILNAFTNLKNATIIITLSGAELLVGKRLRKSKQLF